jgi:hypothetical protein
MKDHAAAEATAIAITGQATKVGGLTSVVAWLADNGYVALFGLMLAAASLLVNVWFQWQRDRREKREHERRMWLMKTKPDHPEVSQ